MQKDFDGWNKKKKEVNNEGNNKFYHSREIWYCRLGVNVGFEQDGKDEEFQRPVLVYKSFSRTTCLVIPLTTSDKKHKYRYFLGQIKGKISSAILSQMKVVDTKRFINRIAILDENIFEEIRKTIKDML